MAGWARSCEEACLGPSKTSHLFEPLLARHAPLQVGWEGVSHIEGGVASHKDFSAIIKAAQVGVGWAGVGWVRVGG